MIERPKMLFSIVERGTGAALIQWLTKQDIAFHKQFVGTGTAPSDMMDILGLGSSDKDVILSFSTAGAIDDMVNNFSKGFNAVVQSRGILAVLEPNAVSNLFVTILNKQTGEHPQGETEMPKNEYTHSLLLITVNRGYADEVMQVARKAGATGGTVIRSRLVGAEGAEKVYGSMLGEEREIIAILTSDKGRDAIMESVNASFGLRTPAQGVLCSLPVDKAYKL